MTTLTRSLAGVGVIAALAAASIQGLPASAASGHPSARAASRPASHATSHGASDRASHGKGTNMHSTRAPKGARTWGRADIDGDGVADTVIVSTKGWVHVHFGGSDRVARISIEANPSRRLQGLPDLTKSGKHEILVADTASGADTGYAFTDSSSTVIVDAHGHLRIVKKTTGHPFYLSFGTGRGDVWAGVQCESGGFVQRSALQTGQHSYRLTKTSDGLHGVTVTKGSKKVTHHHGGEKKIARAGGSYCAGLTRQGWASGYRG